HGKEYPRQFLKSVKEPLKLSQLRTARRSSERRAGLQDQLRTYRRLFANERRPPPPPPGRGRSSRGRASFTVNARPLSSWPLSAVIAALACALSSMVTNANPRDLPVMRSIMRRTSLTWPCCSNRSCRSFSVLSKERLPTYSFICV